MEMRESGGETDKKAGLGEGVAFACKSRNLLQVPVYVFCFWLCATECKFEEKLVDSVHESRGFQRMKGQDVLEFLVVVDVAGVEYFSHRVILVEFVFQLRGENKDCGVK